ncbi:hypothetical protein [Halothermothrix orenii]|uniref:Uncharacterized protein n=1 Tax=Halothermothrix orenii (strain H 168 / OCM 544 / DSM 9562) TaxID=373903 RepID=B8CVZ1_HALOH|nr:hypothetical protein [Halothermothrix orenii]ACL69460.1 hypothetical protein Hore_07030 [Halothermothrix orenii H 168]
MNKNFLRLLLTLTVVAVIITLIWLLILPGLGQNIPTDALKI